VSSIEVANVAGQGTCYHDFKIFPAKSNHAGESKQPAAIPQAASDNSDPADNAAEILFFRICNKLFT